MYVRLVHRKTVVVNTMFVRWRPYYDLELQLYITYHRVNVQLFLPLRLNL